jgi:hypothetical protein
MELPRRCTDVLHMFAAVAAVLEGHRRATCQLAVPIRQWQPA